MDIADEQDVLLQRTSASYLLELQASLPKFLYHGNSVGNQTTRRSVRASTTNHIINLLEPFQEWPQLLDPQLQETVSLLASALLQDVREKVPKAKPRGVENDLVISLSEAICKILYNLCKIRGPKVITRLLSNEAEILEPILGRLEDKLSPICPPGEALDANESSTVKWEEKYVYMLWLSHLLFAPFDLSTVASSQAARLRAPKELALPLNLPPVVFRLTAVSIAHLASAGKERESAVKLLSRLASRPDMLRSGLHTALIEWCLSSLKQDSGSTQPDPYLSIGILNLLGSLSNSISPTALQPLLLVIFRDIMSTLNQSEGSTLAFSAVARKAVNKLLRVLTLSALQLSGSSGSPADYVLEDVIDHLLNSLADNDTPVRQSSSKALSVIASKLDPEMEAEIVEAVVGSLEENVLWLPKDSKNQSIRSDNSTGVMLRDTSAVNPIRWHGLVLSLSQLLFQRSAPSSQLHAVINDLLLALQFEKRASSGISLGSNVRDAANFGIWSIARKYSTKELAEVSRPILESVHTNSRLELSTVQSIAGELVVAACLDPSGNIRRGSSAALQELIGRHPDVIKEGISIVQTVDYHAVALRSRAMCSVALAAAKLDVIYWERLTDSICGWRGLRASDAPSRRLAAQALALLADGYNCSQSVQLVDMILDQIQGLKRRDVEARHGLFLAAAALARLRLQSREVRQAISAAWNIMRPGHIIEDQDLISNLRRPELTAEAVSEAMSCFFSSASSIHDSMDPPSEEILHACENYLEFCLQRREISVITAASKAAAELYAASIPTKKQELVERWTGSVASHYAGGSTVNSHGFLAALGEVYSTTGNDIERQLNVKIWSTFMNILSPESHVNIETRVIAIKSITESILKKISSLDNQLVTMLAMSLQDYTVDQRGDIGSLVRIEAIRAVETAAGRGLLEDSQPHRNLVCLVTTLAGEKLDKVRHVAWTCLQRCQVLIKRESLTREVFDTVAQTSGHHYYEQLLGLTGVDWLEHSVLQGLAVSIGTGSEAVLRAARLALCNYYSSRGHDALMSLASTILSLLRDNQDQDRIAVPVLETCAYLFQSQIISSLLESTPSTGFSKKLFVQVQKAHFKSGNLQKLTSAIEIYGGLAQVETLRGDVLQKLSTMLYHPLPKIRNSAADALYRQTKQARMQSIDWSKSPKEVKRVWTS